MKFEIKNRRSGEVQFTAEIDAKFRTESYGLRLGAAIEVALKARADLARAYLARANLAGADLARAYLAGADLARANLARANLAGAKDIPDIAAAQTSILPEGDLIGWKKCRDGVIVKLQIPAAAKRSNASGRKCRAEYANVLEVIGASEGVSQHDGETEYRAGETVRCDEWGENRWGECSGGIHFFITRLEAENY